jgi:hypothetical protein
VLCSDMSLRAVCPLMYYSGEVKLLLSM